MSNSTLRSSSDYDSHLPGTSFSCDTDPTIALAEVTRQRLHAFRQRRLLLWQCRTIAWTLSIVVGVLLLAMLVDGLWNHPAAQRWGAIAVYTVLALAGLRGWLVTRRPKTDFRAEARLLERLDPRLRERLLSAVELSEASPQIVDSAAFRSQLQQQVARLISAVDMPQLLPWRDVQRPLRVALGAGMVLLLLCLVPSLYVPQRMARILLPMFDWGRIGRIVITLERPLPHSKTVPRDEIVAITARALGPAPSRLQLETRLADGPIRAVDMQPLASHPSWTERQHHKSTTRFESLIPAHESTIDYRVQGEGASTPWYRLTTAARPSVLEFEKHVTPPRYESVDFPKLGLSRLIPDAVETTKNSPANLTSVKVDKHGNLRVLKGSQVQMWLTIDQAVSLAELRWVRATSPAQVTSAVSTDTAAVASANAAEAVLTLKPISDSARPGIEYAVEFSADHSASYKIHLQSAADGIVNEFSPTYELQVVEDLAPSVRWRQPRESSLITTPDQILPLQHEILDELPLAVVAGWFQLNGSGDWQEASFETVSLESNDKFDVEPETARSGPATSTSDDLWQRTYHTTWSVDLLAKRLRPGDYLDVKLKATDLRGQTGESSVLRIHIASAAFAFDAPPAELQRHEVSKRLAAIANKLTKAKQTFDRLLPDRTDDTQSAVGSEMSVDQAASAGQLAAELRQEIAEAIPAVEQAASKATDVLSNQALLRAGEILATLRAATSDPWEETIEQLATTDSPNWEQKLSQTRQSLESESNLANELARHFETLSSYDILSRHGTQLARLAQAERQLNTAINDDEQATEQLQRRQQVLTEQLKAAQTAILNSLPQLRPDSQKALQPILAQLGQQIELIERFDAYGNRQAFSDLTRSMAEQLDRLRLLSQLDSSLSNVVKVAERRLAEMSPTSDKALLRLADLLASDQPSDRQVANDQTQYSRAQLSLRRNLQLSHSLGGREYAADLGNAQRAIEQLHSNASLSDKAHSEAVREIAAAIGTLQAIHHVEQLQQLMRELLHNERWDDKPSELTWHAPRAWGVLDARYEQAAEALRAAQIPNEIVNRLNQIRWGPTAQRAGERLTQRLWQQGQPTSAASDVGRLLEQLTDVRVKLKDSALQARSKLQQHAPTISQLAQQSAERVEKVERQTTQLAEAIERQEVPNVPAQFQELQSQTEALQPPIDSLREALVDQAESQNLLDRQQLESARSADAAIDMVDQIDKQLRGSLPSDILASPAAETPAKLQAAAGLQAESAAALKSLAAHYARLEQTSTDESEVARLAKQTAAQLTEQRRATLGVDDSPTSSAENDRAYQQAQQLAELADQDPRQTLEQLERELPNNLPMSVEMSKVSQQTTRQALDQLNQAAQQQRQIAVAIEQSDPIFKAQLELMLHDVQTVSNDALQMLGTLVDETQLTAAANPNDALPLQIQQAEDTLRTHIEQARNLHGHVSFEEVKVAAADLQTHLTDVERLMRAAAKELALAANSTSHAKEDDLNQRRREMLDRQRRIQQQSVRDAQQSERRQQQRLQQLENDLRRAEQQVEQQVEQHAQQLQKSRQQAENQPDQQWLKDQIAEHEPQLELALSAQTATKKLRDAIERRAEQARQRLEQMNAQELSDLKLDNPTAELAARLAERSAEASLALAQQLHAWDALQLAAPQATARELSGGQERENAIEKVVESVADDLSRAARHEARLERSLSSSELEQAAASTQAIADGELEQAARQLADAKTEATLNGSKSTQASVAATTATLAASGAAHAAIENVAQGLRELLTKDSGGPPTPAQPNPDTTDSPATANNSTSLPSQAASTDTATTDTVASNSPLDGQQKARLLDELDRQLNGKQATSGSGDESNSQAQAGASSDASPATERESPSSPSSLTEAARRLSDTLSRARQPPQPSNSDPSGQATAMARSANLQPQASSPVRVLPVDRGGSQWGQLREQTADDVLETHRDSLTPRYQRQIDAYFRELAEQGRD